MDEVKSWAGWPELPDIGEGNFWYVACPYGSHSKEVVERNMEIYGKMDSILSKMGYLTFSPLDKHYKLHHAGMPGDFAYWRNYCMSMLKLAKGLVVIMAPGWTTSPGVQEEVEEAQRLGLTIAYVHPY